MSAAPRWRATAPEHLPDELAERADVAAAGHAVRVAVDGPPCAHPETLAEAMLEPLRLLGRDGVHVRSDVFWRDASLRLEYGRQDAMSYYDWLDAAALQREVLAPVRERDEYLPSLRDPVTNRSTRATARPATSATVLVVSGPLLMGRGLDFDLTVHLRMSPAARARRTPEDQAWTLPAFDRYDREAVPSEGADIVIRMDDPRHPAVRG